jgi:mono/diheme cytochrome c family protein
MLKCGIASIELWSERMNRKTVTCLAALFAAVMAMGLATPATARDSGSSEGATAPRVSMLMPIVDPARGRRLFVSKGCFICHGVGGVGGKAAPPLDATAGSTTVDVLDFVARMWRGAQAMITLQSIELGYKIELTPDEIADLSAFASLASAQAGFSVTEIPELMRGWTLDEPYWEDDFWPEDLLREPGDPE